MGDVVVQLHPIRNLDLKGRGWSSPRPGRFNLEKYLVTIVQVAGMPHSRCKPMSNISPPTGIRSQDRPAQSVSL